jgi:hypothetical protein
MRARPSDFQKLDLRCHKLLADVPLHDVWKIPLHGGGTDRTMRDVLAISPASHPSSLAVRGLFALRRALGAQLGLDR